VAALEALVSRIIGAPCAIRVEWTVAGQAEQAPAEPNVPRGRRQRNEWASVPLIGNAMEIFGAQIVQADEGFDPTTSSRPAPADPQGETD